jgi:hypothetical protein
MRPFVKREDRPWQQEASNLMISQEPLKYQKQNLSMALEELQPSESTFRKLSF